MSRTAAIGLPVAVGAIAFAFALAPGGDAPDAVPLSGPMPQIEGPTLAGKPVDPADLVAPVLVLNFWASWCAPCREEQPGLERLWREYEGDGVRFVGVDSMDLESDALAFVDEYEVTYPSVSDPRGDLMRKFEVAYLPATVLVRAGRLVSRLPGARTEDELRLLIEELLAGP